MSDMQQSFSELQKHRASTVGQNRREWAEALASNWPEYMMEAAELGLFMFSACSFSVFIFHPDSLVGQLIPSTWLKRVLMGLAMGSTAVAIIYSPFGKRSGAHFNPAVTLTYLRLGKVEPWDAAFYTLFQFGGGILGVVLAALCFGGSLSDMSVNYAATIPGPAGLIAAFAAENLISFVLMTVILNVSNHCQLSRWTGLFAGALVAIYISIESPISGMSMNPARTFASASVGGVWTALWIYFTAPIIGMLLAAEVYRLTATRSAVCAKLHHHNNQRCIFHCNFAA